jgi:competence protein ComEC
MLYWIPYAFVRISVFFIAGILLGIYFPQLISISSAMSAFTFAIALYFFIFFLNRRRNKRVLNPGLIALTAVLIAGYCSVYFNTETNSADHITHASNKILYYCAVINDYGQEKENTWKEVAKVKSIFDGNTWKPASGAVLLYFRKADFPGRLQYGDELLIKGSPALVPTPANPGEFDYQKYLAAKNVYHQQFVAPNGIVVVGHRPESMAMDFSIAMRIRAEEQLKKVVSGERERAIASALVLGIAGALDNELMSAYAATGALHVLSVSGLHVGILYLILMFIFKPFLKFRNGKWIVASLCLISLWIYACVTGLSPSVLRAVTMFSFMVVARPLNQRTNIYNVLTASAFCLLLFDPFLILSVGFQLSYLAVLGIVYLQPLLYNLVEPQSRILDELWKVSCVAIAAQTATFALGLLYFHQFPNYFLLSNLYVLPLGFGILVGGLSVLAFSFIPPLASLLGFLLEWMIRIMNYLILFTESLPYSVISNIQISVFQCTMLMVLTAGLIFFLQYRIRWLWYASALSIILFAVSAWVWNQNNFAGPRLSVYKVPGRTAYDLIESGKAFAFIDNHDERSKIDFQVQPNRLIHQVNVVYDGGSEQFSRNLPFGRITCYGGKTFLQIKSQPEGRIKRFNADYVILSDNGIRSWDQISDSISANFIIIDSSNSFRVADKLLKEIQSRNQPVHSVWHQGAFDKTI